MPPSGSNPLEPVIRTVAAFSRRLLIAPDTAPDEHRLRPLLSLSLSPPSSPPPLPEVLKEKDVKVVPLTKEEVGCCSTPSQHSFLMNQPGSKDGMQKSCLGKQIFPCQRVNARWGKLDCPERLCDLEGSNDIMPNR